jgi:NAD-dependent deacetylase
MTPASPSPADPLAALADRLQRASRVTILTGAGVSAASGIPTFRGAGGLWRNFKAKDLATAGAFERDPLLVWQWYDWRRGLIHRAAPNDAHEVIARWTRERPGTTLITQNVDGLHERAGSANVLRLHGSIWHLRCWDQCEKGRASWTDESVPLDPLPPRCTYCGGLARPGVVWFGESLDADIVSLARAATSCDVFLTIGTSAMVYPAAGLAHEAKARGAFTVEINPDATEASTMVDLTIRRKAEEVLVELARSDRVAPQVRQPRR